MLRVIKPMKEDLTMTIVTRRKVLQLGSVSLLGGIVIPSGKRISTEEHLQLTNAIEDNIFAGWKLFHTTNMDSMLSLGQAQLFLLRQIHANLHPYVLAIQYSGIYRLIGAIHYMQGHYHEAYKFQGKAYRAASEGNDAWSMAQTLSWQAYGWMALERYTNALETTEAALQLILHQDDLENIRLRARLLALGAEDAMLGGTLKGTESKLDESKALLDFLPALHEEFDRASWHQYAGVCAMHQSKLDLAIEYFQQSLNELPPQWILRYANTLLSLAKVYARHNERDASITMAEKAVSAICSINASSQYKQLRSFIQEDLLNAFPGDKKVRNFVANAQLTLASVPLFLLPS
jgi:tetratricopeptide (TPR) repeat protein